MLYKQKGVFQKLCRWFAGSWMTANTATLLAFLAILVITGSFYLGLTYSRLHFLLLLVPFMLIFRMAMNALDGMLSREYGTATVAGELWNEALDIIGDTISYGSLYFVTDGPGTAIVIFILLSWCAEFFGVLGKGMPNGTRRHEALLGGKPDRAIWMGLLALILYIYPDFLAFSHYYIYGSCIFIGITIYMRIAKILSVSKGADYNSYTWIGK